MTLLQIYHWVCQWKNFEKSVNIWRSYGQEFSVFFFWLTLSLAHVAMSLACNFFGPPCLSKTLQDNYRVFTRGKQKVVCALLKGDPANYEWPDPKSHSFLRLGSFFMGNMWIFGTAKAWIYKFCSVKRLCAFGRHAAVAWYGHGQGNVTHRFRACILSWKVAKLGSTNFVYRLIVVNISVCMMDFPQTLEKLSYFLVIW